MQRMCQWQWNARLTAREQSKDSPAHEVSSTAPLKAMHDSGADEVPRAPIGRMDRVRLCHGMPEWAGTILADNLQGHPVIQHQSRIGERHDSD